MFIYEKKLQYPVKIRNTNPALAKFIISQYGGPDGELGASLRYLSQRYSMPYPELKGLLTDIGTEELGHLEMIGAVVHQLTRDLTVDEVKKAGFDAYFVDHTAGIYPAAASGFPWNAGSMQVKGDVIADLSEDLAAEQKARVTYDNILRLSDDPDVNNVMRYLREREVVHYQRFGEALRLAADKLNEKNYYAVRSGSTFQYRRYYSLLQLFYCQDSVGLLKLVDDLLLQFIMCDLYCQDGAVVVTAFPIRNAVDLHIIHQDLFRSEKTHKTLNRNWHTVFYINIYIAAELYVTILDADQHQFCQHHHQCCKDRTFGISRAAGKANDRCRP